MDEDDKDLRLDDELDEPTLDEMGEESEEDFNIDKIIHFHSIFQRKFFRYVFRKSAYYERLCRIFIKPAGHKVEYCLIAYPADTGFVSHISLICPDHHCRYRIRARDTVKHQ